MYLTVLKRSTEKICEAIENYFGYYMTTYKDEIDKEDALRKLFIRLFADKDIENEG